MKALRAVCTSLKSGASDCVNTRTCCPNKDSAYPPKLVRLATRRSGTCQTLFKRCQHLDIQKALTTGAVQKAHSYARKNPRPTTPIHSGTRTCVETQENTTPPQVIPITRQHVAPMTNMLPLHGVLVRNRSHYIKRASDSHEV